MCTSAAANFERSNNQASQKKPAFADLTADWVITSEHQIEQLALSASKRGPYMAASGSMCQVPLGFATP